MSSQTDLDISRQIRRLMVRHWIDLGRLSIRSTGGRVLLCGTFKRIDGVNDPLTTPIVEGIFRDIRQAKNVRFVGAHLENWTNAGGMWRPVEGTESNDDKSSAKSPPPQTGGNTRSYTLRQASDEGPGA